MAKAATGLAEIEARYRAELQARKAELMSEVAQIDAKLKALGRRAAQAPKTRRAPARRPRRPVGKSLRTHIEQVLSKAASPMKVRDIEAAVRKADYKTQSKDFYHSVYALLRQSDKVRKAGKGLFAIKKASKPRPERKGKKSKA